jgi:AbrB family looped-hinge helix DNA binding protein
VKVALREKGRITIPAEIRKALGLRKGDMLQLSTRHAEIILKPAKVVSAKEIRGIIGRFKVENEEIEEALGRAN